MSINRVAYDSQNVYIEGERLQGVQSCVASWTSPESYVNAIGYEGGFVGTSVDEPLFSQIEIDRIILSPYDPIASMLNRVDISGEAKSSASTFAFTEAFVDSYSCSCAVGELPTISCSMTAYGDSGGGVSALPISSEPDGDIIIATPGSLELDVFGHSSNAIQSFELSMNISREPVSIIGQKKPEHYIVDFPIQVDCAFELIIQDYASSDLSNFICSPRQQDINLIFRDCESGDEIRRFFMPKARLVDYSQTAGIGDSLIASFSYKSLVMSLDNVEKVLKGEAFL